MLNGNVIPEMLDTTFVQLTDVWTYSPNTDRARWDGNYERVDSEARPTYRNASFDLRLNDGNGLGLTAESVGIYVIRDDISMIYIGKTEKHIGQRFNAHISRFTAAGDTITPRDGAIMLDRGSKLGIEV